LNDVWSFALNENDSFDNAQRLSYNVGANTEHSAVLDVGELDHYLITLPDGNYNFTTSGSTDTRCALYSIAPIVVVENDDDSGTGDNCSITRNLLAGDYYVQVRGADDNITGAYTLHIAVQ
jgi:tyrosinase